MCFPSIPVLRCSAHLSPGLPPCFGPLLFYCAPPGCFWRAQLSFSFPLGSMSELQHSHCQVVVWACVHCITISFFVFFTQALFVSPSSSSLLLILSYHLIFIIHLRHRFWNTSIFLALTSFVFHVSHPYIRTGLTNVLYSRSSSSSTHWWNFILDLAKSYSCVPRLNFFKFQNYHYSLTIKVNRQRLNTFSPFQGIQHLFTLTKVYKTQQKILL